MNEQHGNRHRRFEPPHVMEPGAPETVEAIHEARVTGLARMAWAQRPQVFQIDPAWRPSAQWSRVVAQSEARLLDIIGRLSSDDTRGHSDDWWTPSR